jgi:hypothetical protein
MRGLITGRDVVLLAVAIIRIWGLPMYLWCLRARLSRRRRCISPMPRLPDAVEPQWAGGTATSPTIDPGFVIEDASGV